MTALVLNDELQLLKDSAKRLLQKESPVEALRSLRDERSEKGYSPELWQSMVEMGWVAMTIPEEHEGLGAEYAALGPIMEEMGRNLVASPYFSTVVLGASLIDLAGNGEQKAQLLPAIAGGEKLIALALEETNHHAPENIGMEAVKSSGGYSLSGQKIFVLDGHVANTLIVPVRTSGERGDKHGITLFMVDGSGPDLAPGLAIERTVMVDSRNAATLTFNEVEIPESSILGELHEGFSPLEKALDIGRICLAAEMLGLAQEAFERTQTYLKTRKQFGVHIGSFQALQHRSAEMFCELELAKSAVLKALLAIDEDDPELPQLASMAKYTMGQVTKLITREAIQMFGGIGMTDEEEIGFFLKRAMAAEHALGGESYHLDRYARLRGY